MEDSSCTDDTLRLYRELREAGHENVGVVLQAYLRRTIDDVQAVDDLRPNVRLCKGIYVEPPHIAFHDFEAVRANFVKTLDALFDAGSYVGIATHDEWLVDEGRRIVSGRRLSTSQYEFQILLRAREDGVLVVDKELPSRTESRGDPARPRLHDLADPAVDEVEPRAAELQRQLVDVALDEGDRGRVLAGGGHGLGGRVDPGHECAEPGELRRRLSRAAPEVEDVPALELGEPLLDSGGQAPQRGPEPPGHRVPGAPGGGGRAPPTTSGKPPSTTRGWPRTISASREARKATAPASERKARAFAASVQSQCLSFVSSAVRMTPVAALWTTTSKGACDASSSTTRDEATFPRTRTGTAPAACTSSAASSAAASFRR